MQSRGGFTTFARLNGPLCEVAPADVRGFAPDAVAAYEIDADSAAGFCGAPKNPTYAVSQRSAPAPQGANHALIYSRNSKKGWHGAAPRSKQLDIRQFPRPLRQRGYPPRVMGGSCLKGKGRRGSFAIYVRTFGAVLGHPQACTTCETFSRPGLTVFQGGQSVG